MEIMYYEIYLKNDICKPLLELTISNDNNIKNINGIYKISKSNYCIDIQHSLFDNLKPETLKYIDEVFKNLKVSYLNKERWNEYLDRKYEEELKTKHIATRTLPIVEPKSIAYYGKSNHKPRDDKYKFEFDNNLENLYTNYNRNSNKVLLYEDIASNEIEFITKFFYIIFNANFTLGIRKCDNCNRYFITKPGNNFKCKREFTNGLTCSEYSDRIRRQHYNEDPIKALKKHVKDLLKKDPDELYNFCIEDAKNKIQYYNDNKLYVIWLLSFYRTKVGKDRIIQKLGLSIYL